MITFRILLFIIFTMLCAEASIYEDAEDQRTSRWELISARDASNIKNVWDSSKKSHVIAFEGEGTQHSYGLKIKQSYQNEHWLSWDMKISGDFVIIIVLDTNMGEYHLIYTPGIFKGYMQYGLGNSTNNGKWQTIKRDIQEDIAYFDNRVKTVSLKSFVIKGTGKIDNIMTKKTILPKKMMLPKKDNLDKVKKEKKEYIEKRVFKNSLPTIQLKGIRLIKLALGEKYIEEGVSAYDKEDGKINVESTNHINPYEAGRYMVLYMAKDSEGNMAVDKRYVEVGSIKDRKIEVKIDTKKLDVEDKLDDDEDEEEVNYSVQEEQIRKWEEELARKEKELAKKRVKR